jgi:hypothetical protein
MLNHKSPTFQPVEHRLFTHGSRGISWKDERHIPRPDQLAQVLKRSLRLCIGVVICHHSFSLKQSDCQVASLSGKAHAGGWKL